MDVDDCRKHVVGRCNVRRVAAALRWASWIGVVFALLPVAAFPGGPSVEMGARLGGGDGIHTRAVYARWPAEFVQDRLVEPYLPAGGNAFWDFTVEHWTRTDHPLDLFVFGPVFAYPLVEPSLKLSFGLQPSFLSGDSRYRDEVGGSVQFTSHVGLRWKAMGRWSLALRIQHTSNGGIDRPNPGVDGAKLALGYRF